MDILERENKFRINVVEKKEEEIKKIEDELTKINLKKKEEEEHKNSDEYKQKKEKEKEAYKRKMVFGVFKEEVNRDMTEEEYKTYLKDYEKAEIGFTLWTWLLNKGLIKEIETIDKDNAQ